MFWTRKPKGLVIPCRMGMLCCTEVYPSNLSVLTTPFYDVLTIWPLLISHDLWTPPNITKKKNRSVLKGIQLRWVLDLESSFDLWWPHITILGILGKFCFLTSDNPRWRSWELLGKFALWPLVTPDDDLDNSWEILLFNLWWPQMTFDFHKKQQGSSLHHGKSIYQLWKGSVIAISRYRVYKLFTRLLQFNLWWPQMTFDLYQKR